MSKILINYRSNNSGGTWWLDDKDWKNLELSGWKVDWEKDEPLDKFRPRSTDRWLGALATSASIEADTIKEALESFEKATGQNVSDEGCSCCGAPHCFSWNDETGHNYISGEDCLEYLFPNASGKSLRDFYRESDLKR